MLVGVDQHEVWMDSHYDLEEALPVPLSGFRCSFCTRHIDSFSLTQRERCAYCMDGKELDDVDRATRAAWPGRYTVADHEKVKEVIRGFDLPRS